MTSAPDITCAGGKGKGLSRAKEMDLQSPKELDTSGDRRNRLFKKDAVQ